VNEAQSWNLYPSFLLPLLWMLWTSLYVQRWEQSEGRDRSEESHISCSPLDTNVGTQGDENLGFFHLPGSNKEKCIPSLGLFQQSEETISGSSKGFYIRKKKAENKQMAHSPPPNMSCGKLVNFFPNLFRTQRQKAPLKTLFMAESSFKL